MTIDDLRIYPLVYLATPYTLYKKGIDAAFIDAATVAGGLVIRGVRVYSPIVATHPVAVYSGLDPYDVPLYLALYKKIMESSDALLVANLPGWEKSEGVKYERNWFKENGVPSFLLDIDTWKVSYLSDYEQQDRKDCS